MRAHFYGGSMKINSHYKKIINLSKQKFLNISDDELLQLYQFDKDCEKLLEEFEVVIGEELYQGILTGIFRTSQHCYYRLECNEEDVFFISDDLNHGGIMLSKEDVIHDLKKESRILRFKRKREKVGIYTFVSIMLVISLLAILIPKQPEPLLIEFSSTQTYDYSNIAELYEDHHAGIVTVYTYSAAEEKQSVATGMLITKDGYLISCTHIYDDIPNAKFSIVLSDGSMHHAVFVTGDVESDICLLKIVNPDRDYPIIRFGDSDEVRPGDKCVIMGFPGGASIEPIITSGIISSMDVRHSNLTGYLNSYIQTDATANPGNSGGGLFNMKGQVIGIVTSKYTQSNYEGTIYSISSKTIKQVINDLFYTGYVSRPTLGITFTTTTNLELDQGVPYGSKVVEVKDTSKAFGLLNSGDIILEVNGKTISPAYELYDVIFDLPTDNPELTCKVYNPETKETRIVTFSATMRYSSTGYKQE